MADPVLTLEFIPPPDVATVCAHAWQETETGDSEYVDFDSPEGERAAGCVYLRTVSDETGKAYNGGAFDIPEERDFPTHAEAFEFAESYAQRHGLELMIY